MNYYGVLLTLKQQEFYFSELLNTINWKNDEALIFGKRIITKRKVAWYGEQPFEYRYSGATKTATPFTDVLWDLKKEVEAVTGEIFNSCLLNLYHSGEEGMAWHSDGEKDLVKNAAIASLSFGAERKFLFKHKKTNQSIDIILESGSLLVMKGETQTYWLHRLPPTKKERKMRINLTFRTIFDKK